MEGPVKVNMNKLGLDVAVGGARAAQARADMGNPMHRREPTDYHRGLRCGASLSFSQTSAAALTGGSPAVEPPSRAAVAREREEPPLRGLRPLGAGNSATVTAAHALFAGGGPAAAPSPTPPMPQTIEEFAAQDLEAFWRWCPTPADGLHRCALLLKLFDYCGLNRKEHKTGAKVGLLDRELRILGVTATDAPEAHQRVQHEAFVQCRRLRNAVCECAETRAAWEHRRRAGKPAEGKTPLAIWVLSVISARTDGGLQQAHAPEAPSEGVGEVSSRKSSG